MCSFLCHSLFFFDGPLLLCFCVYLAVSVTLSLQAEELFYNMDTRRRAFKSPGEQYRGILDVVTRYAVHFGDRGVSFTCKKARTYSIPGIYF